MSDSVNSKLREQPGFSDDSGVFRSEVSVILSSVREELDDHRQAINETTNEVESNFEFLVEIARKIDALTERLDALTLHTQIAESLPRLFQVDALTPREKQVFAALYALTEDDPEVTYARLASRLGCSEELVAGYITNLMEKGVLVRKRYVNKTARLSLDLRFRQEQAQANLVRLDIPLTAWL